MVYKLQRHKEIKVRKKLNTTLGFYSPSFLRMHVGTKESLKNLFTLNDDYSESVFLHEYSHFIQDITTTYGLVNICRTADYMRFVNNHVISLPEGNFPVPVLPDKDDPGNVNLNLELSSIYNGCGEDDNVTLLAHSKLQTSLNANSKNYPVEYIEAKYSTPAGATNCFKFGGICILESMAYIIESECYPNCYPSPDLPYSSAEKLVGLIYPEFGNDRLNVLALCDASLKDMNPGPFFYDTLLKIKNDKTTISKPEDVYQICNQAQFNFNGAKDFNSLLSKMCVEATTQFDKYFNDPRFHQIKDWLKNMITEGVNYRLQNDTFPLEIARNGKLSSNIPFRQLMQKVGTPLITNEIGETFLYDPMPKTSIPDYSTIWAIDQIHSIFWGEQKHCELVDFCCSSGISTDARCTNKPWERNLDPTCAFGQIWRHWGLTDYIPN